jgi:hypothetical protein
VDSIYSQLRDRYLDACVGSSISHNRKAFEKFGVTYCVQLAGTDSHIREIGTAVISSALGSTTRRMNEVNYGNKQA